MESIFRTHAYLIEHNKTVVRRNLMDEINWNDRLIGIKGARGVGKTTFLLEYAKERFGTSRDCLFINMNNFYFASHSIVDFADYFQHQGGKVLLIDQVFKHPNWSKELRECYDRFPNLQIIFTGSSVMRLKEENDELNGIVKSYNLPGLSFREFINLKADLDLPTYNFEDILRRHRTIAKEIRAQVNPLDYFHDYLHHGYYPFFLEKRNYSENLLKTMNMMVEVDILLIKQIELKYLSKIKELFYRLAVAGPKAPNVSQLATDIHTSRATVMNYMKYLADARLINMVYAQGESFPKKPARILLHNSNLMYTIYPYESTPSDIHNTFIVNALWKDHVVNEGDKSSSFIIDNKYEIKMNYKRIREKQHKAVFYLKDDIEIGEENVIPLWLFGFLY
jgi:predicted AAA+ superfamily ATPase